METNTTIPDDDHQHPPTLKRKDHPEQEQEQQQLDRVPKRLKNYFQSLKEEKDFNAEEVDFTSFLSKGTEIIKTWHVRKARNLLLELVQVGVGQVPNHDTKTVLDSMVDRREEIESLSLYLARSMVIKCQVHSTEFIHDMLEHNRTVCKENEISQATFMFENEEDDDATRKKQLLNDWEKFTLPQLVKIQQDLNLVGHDEEETSSNNNLDEQVQTIMDYETVAHDDDFAYHLDTHQKPLEFGCSKEEQIQRLNSLDETEIKEVSEKSQWNDTTDPAGEPVHVRYDNETNEYIYTEKELEEYDGFIDDEALYCKYLFDEMLPDESQMSYMESPFADLKFSLETKYHNPFLYILETTMKMFVKSDKSQTPEEHQTFEVSYLRLATSLYILNCMNTELVYLKNRVSMGAFQLMARATVRGVLDSFIDNRNFSCFKMDPEAYTYVVVKPEDSDIVKDLEEDLKYFLNGNDRFEEDNESVTSSVTSPINSEEIPQPASHISYGEEKDGEDNKLGASHPSSKEGDNSEEAENTSEENDEIMSCSTDTDTDTDSEVEYDNYLVGHPVWDNPIDISQSEVEEMNFQKKRVIDPVSKSLSSTFEYLKSNYISAEEEEDVPIQEPIVNQELVTFYYHNNGHFLKEHDLSKTPDSIFSFQGSRQYHEPECSIICADHILDFAINQESQLPEANSIYRDMTRLMRRGSVMCADSGAYLESFLSLKEYIQGVIEYLALTKEDKIVTDEDVLLALKRVHQHSHYTGGHSIQDFKTVHEYTEKRMEFTTTPVFPPENFDDIHLEKLYFNEEVQITKKDFELDERFEYNDPLVEDEHFSDYICYYLGEMSEIPGSDIICDTFIEFEGGGRLGLYSPLIKFKCPSFYEKFLSKLVPKNHGVNVQLIKEVLPDVDFDILHEFFEYVYRGSVFAEYDELLSPYVEKIENMFEIVPGVYERDIMLANSCCTLKHLWDDDSTKDFTLKLKSVALKVHKFILASRMEFFRKIITENPSTTEYDVSDVVTDELVLERFIFYLYHNALNYHQDDEEEEEEDEEETEESNEETIEGESNEETAEKDNESGNDSDASMEEDDQLSEVEEIELTLAQNIELFKLAHKIGDNNLSLLMSRAISHEIDYSNVSNFLTFSFEYQSYELFKACEFILLSSDNSELIEQVTELDDEREYFKTLCGPIDETNVVEKLSYTMKILNAPSSELEFYFIHRLDDFHKRNLIWYIIRNISRLDNKILECLQYIPVDEKTNCAQVVQFLAKRYYGSLDSFAIPNESN